MNSKIWVFFVAAVAVEATTIRHLRSNSTLKISKTRRQSLPPICESSCAPAGQDPFVEKHEFCGELYSQCGCCSDAVGNRINSICQNFMGYGGCIKGIKAAIERKEADCKQQKAINDYNKEQQKRKINEAAGRDILGLSKEEESQSSGKKKLGPYDDDCAEYTDPSCKFDKALCAADYGCNKALWELINELDAVETHKGMLDNLPCFA
eukprot:TRINITY_DN109958_c0_g1_i1.p1 TRINITY_DN109958_c0_g1~~TRINITY_DN109958_c0_g1_i1.p1  ORF type:complete len:208 (-),score=49.29 TRINITY_DN109958_c0_g1_i1:84-707(-)